MKFDSDRFIERFWRAFNDHAPEDIAALMTADALLETSFGGHAWGDRIVGRAAIRDFYVEMFTRIPDARWIELRRVVCPTHIVLEFIRDGHSNERQAVRKRDLRYPHASRRPHRREAVIPKGCRHLDGFFGCSTVAGGAVAPADDSVRDAPRVDTAPRENDRRASPPSECVSSPGSAAYCRYRAPTAVCLAGSACCPTSDAEVAGHDLRGLVVDDEVVAVLC